MLCCENRTKVAKTLRRVPVSPPPLKKYEYFSKILKSWYRLNKRALPWRDSENPYEIWVSEVILQQTRVQQGLGYYRRFVEKFPSVAHLSKASEEEVLGAWEGLGYYTRARNLLKGAQYIVRELGGVFPNDKKSWQRMAGVGDYTAAAIASFAFGERVPVLDGNVYRVVARVFGIKDDVTTARSKKVFLEQLQVLMPQRDPATFNQAIMEFGALQCKPVPHCAPCPMRKRCYAFRERAVTLLPKKSRVKKMKNRYLHYLFLWSAHSILLVKRKKDDIWKGLYELPCAERHRALSWEELVEGLPSQSRDKPRSHGSGAGESLLAEMAQSSEMPCRVCQHSHKLTHQHVAMKFFYFPLLDTELLRKLAGVASLRCIPHRDALRLPMPVVLARAVKGVIGGTDKQLAVWLV